MKVKISTFGSDVITLTLKDILYLLLFGSIKEGATIIRFWGRCA